MTQFKRFLSISLSLVLSQCATPAFAAGTYIKGPALIEGFTAVTSAAGTTTLTVSSETKQILTGTSTQTFVLPDATTLPLGRMFYVINKSTGTATVNANGGSLVASVLAGQQKEFHLRAAGSAAGTWDATRILVDVANDVTGTLPIANGGTGQVTAQAAVDALLPSQTSNSGKYLTTNGTASSWGTVTAGTGDVVGPASSTADGFVKFNGTTGKLVKDSAATISNSDVNSSAAIAVSKMAALTASKAMVTDGSGFSSASTVTTTELGLLSGVTGTLATTAGTQALTNKDFDGGTASNTSRITVPKAAKTTLDSLTRKQGTVVFDTTGNRPYYDDGSNLVSLVPGSASGINYITNYDAETDVTGWATYADAAGTRPVDGTGGSPTLTFTRNITSPLRGTASFLMSKPASNVQGQGASYAFTISRADQAKVLQISFDYSLASGTYSGGTSSTDSDLIIDIYDVTNGAIIETAPIKLDGSVQFGLYKYTGSFQTASNSTSYRFIIHQATTSASAFTMQFDNIAIGPQVLSFGGSVGEWTAFTPTGTFTTNTTYTGMWRRVGSNMELQYKLAFAGAPNAGNLVVNLPSGYVIDTTKMANSGGSQWNLGAGQIYRASTGYGFTLVGSYNSTTAIDIRATDSSSAYALSAADVTATIPYTIASGDALNFTTSVPIVGWGASQTLSSETDTRVVAAVYKTSAAPSMVNGATTRIDFATVESDSHSAVTTGASWVYTAPVSGFYSTDAAVTVQVPVSSGVVFQLYLYRDGVQVADGPMANYTTSGGAANTGVSLNRTIWCNAGQTLDVRFRNDSGTSRSLTASANDNHISIRRVSGPSQIAASESVETSYTHAASTSIPDATVTIVPFDTVEWDTHSAFTIATGRFTAPVSGKYRVDASVQWSITAAIGTNFNGYLYKNGSLYKAGTASTSQDAGTSAYTVGVGTSVRLLAGEYIDFRVRQNAGSAKALNGSVNLNHISIFRSGNY